MRACPWLGLFCLVSACGAENEPREVQEQPAPSVDPFCETRPRLEFCEDFSSGEIPGVFEGAILEGGLFEFDSKQPASAPHALKARLTGDGEGSLSRAYLHAGFTTGQQYRIFSQLRLERLPSSERVDANSALGLAEEVSLLEYYFPEANYRINVGLNALGELFTLERLGDEELSRVYGERQFKLGVWTSVRFDVDLPGDGTGLVYLRLGNDTVVRFEGLTPPALVGAPRAHFGLESQGDLDWELGYDNLTVEINQAPSSEGALGVE